MIDAVAYRFELNLLHRSIVGQMLDHLSSGPPRLRSARFPSGNGRPVDAYLFSQLALIKIELGSKADDD